MAIPLPLAYQRPYIIQQQQQADIARQQAQQDQANQEAQAKYQAQLAEYNRQKELNDRIQSGKISYSEFTYTLGKDIPSEQKASAYIDYLAAHNQTIDPNLYRMLPEHGVSYTAFGPRQRQVSQTPPPNFSSETQGPIYVAPGTNPANNFTSATQGPITVAPSPQYQLNFTPSIPNASFPYQEKLQEPNSIYNQNEIQSIQNTVNQNQAQNQYFDFIKPKPGPSESNLPPEGIAGIFRGIEISASQKAINYPEKNFTYANPIEEYNYNLKKTITKSVAGGIYAAAYTGELIFNPAGTYRGLTEFTREGFYLGYINGVQQIRTNNKFFSEYRDKLIKSVTTQPEFFAGTIIGGFATDTIFTNPLTEFASRPVINVYSRLRLSYEGAEAATIVGSPGTSFLKTKEGINALLVENIHESIYQVPGTGDLSLSELKAQAKIGTGKKIELLSFVRGGLADAQKGDTFLLREIELHYRGVKSSPFYSSPELELAKDITIRTVKGETQIIPKGTILQIGAKQFAEDLVTGSEYEGLSFSLRRKKNVAIRRSEVNIEPNLVGMNNFEASREFYNPKYSGVTTSAQENNVPFENPASFERQRASQTQRKFPYPSRGSTLKFPEPENVTYPIFTTKELPFGLAKKAPIFQEIYEDIGFGRQFKDVTFLKGELGIPVGRPPSKAFQGEPIAERPTARAFIQNPYNEKILFVKEGEQPFLFPGGGVEQIDIVGQGKEGVRLGYPKDYLSDLRREVFEETGLYLKNEKKVPGTIKGPVTEMNPSVNNTFLYKFQDITTIYRAEPVIDFVRPRGEITEVGRFTPREALARTDIGPVERQFIEKEFGIKSPKTGKLPKLSTNPNRIVFDLDQTILQGTTKRKGIENTLRELKSQGYDLVVFTHSRGARAEQLLGETGLRPYFSEVISREQYALGRGPASFKNIKKIGGTILVEDSTRQISKQARSGTPTFQVSKNINEPILAGDIIRSIPSKRKNPFIFDYYRRPKNITLEENIGSYRNVTPINRNYYENNYSKKYGKPKIDIPYFEKRQASRTVNYSREIKLERIRFESRIYPTKYTTSYKYPIEPPPARPTTNYPKTYSKEHTNYIEPKNPKYNSPYPSKYPILPINRVIPNNRINENKKKLVLPSFGPAFKFLYKQGGKIRLSAQTYTRQDVGPAAKSFLRNTLRASEKPIQVGGYAPQRYLQGVNLPGYVNKKGFFVQARGTRLGTRGEIKEIQFAKRLKRGRLL